MARKYSKARTRGRAAMEVAGAGASAFLNPFLANFTLRVRNEAEALLNKVEERTIHVRDRIMAGIYFSLIITVAGIFLTVAALMFMVQGGLTWATAFLIAAIALAIIGLLFYQKAK